MTNGYNVCLDQEHLFLSSTSGAVPIAVFILASMTTSSPSVELVA